MFNARNKNVVRATIYDSDGKKVSLLQGKWNEGLNKVLDDDKFEILWKIEEPSPDHKDYYGFTQFGIELNEITALEDGYLPNTDSRLRPDQRMFEEGNLLEAEKVKSILEERQRAFRKDPKCAELVPHWFERVKDPANNNESFKYKGGYWEDREKKSFPAYIEIFDFRTQEKKVDFP